MSGCEHLFWARAGKFCFWLLWIIEVPLAVWCCGAIWYPHWLGGEVVRGIAMAFFATAMLTILIASLKQHCWILAGLLLSAGVIVCWLTLLHPTGIFDCDPPFAKFPVAHFSADESEVTIENIRDFHYRSEKDYDIRYRTETYRFDEIKSMDYSITHWNGSEPFGHIMLVFNFNDGRHLVFSPEARMERGKLYEILPGIFRRYELIFIFATEQDAIKLRTHHRKYEQEEVLLYPTNTQPEVAAYLLKDFLRRSNRLAQCPEFYNGITYNCLSCMAPTAEKLGFDFCSTWRGIFNGYSDRTGYYTGWLKRSRPDESYADYRRRHTVNQYVENLEDPPDFSALIRPDDVRK
ncbi:MAG: DUF4105 domain-containing protein [Victivallaceae bacterium]|nr:DUF4105 domain-containing protein [Victivallaceae bacterium]